MLQVAVANGSTTVTADTKTALSVDNPVPTFTSVSPSMVPVGSTAATVTVTGTNFVQGVALSVNGSPRSSTYVSATQFTSELTAADFSTASPLLLNVINPQPGGGASGTSSLAVNNPAPAIASINPRTIVAGSAGVTVAVTGTGFVPGTLVSVNGATRTSSYVNSSQMNVLLTTADFTNAGTLAITATNPAPGGGVSPTAAIFSVTAKPATGPSISFISPATMYVGSGDNYLSVYGAGFAANTVVQWNGTALPTSYAGSYLYAKVAANLLSATGTANITAYTSTAIVPTSNVATLAITNPPVPTLTSLSTTVAPIATDTTILLYGTGFTGGTVAYFNGTKLVPNTYTSTSLTVTIPAASLLFPGVGNVSVTTPAPGGGTSASLPFTTYVPIVNNSMIYNPTNGLLYLSIPSSVGAPYGNTIVSMDPATGALGTPVPVGSEPNKLALTSDGKYLWVGLDGASAVRKVDLTTNTPGFQFALNGGTSGISTATELAALPGATDSVVVLQSYNTYYGVPTIYDSGVLRGTVPTSTYYGQYALQVDGSRSEVYVGGSNGLTTYTYNSSGLTLKTQNTNYSIVLAQQGFDEMQLISGSLYTDFGKVYDAEAGTLLGNMYVSGTTNAQGPTFYDTGLSKIFTLDYSGGYYYNGYNQIQIFSPTDYTASASVIPVSVPYSTYNPATFTTTYLTANRLTRWGTNGLAFRTNVGVFSLRSNLVKDVSSTIADLGVTVTASGATTTGNTTTYSFSVTNSGPSTATDVALGLQLPSTGVLKGASVSSGSCSTQTGGCSLGSIANGATVTGTISVLQTSAGTGALTAQVTASTTDNNSANDRATASAVVTGDTYNLTPTLSSISPAAIRSGSGDTTITVAGANFASGSVVMLGNTPLSTSYTSSTTLTATIPAANLASLGWASVTVSSPAPGGGFSNATPLTVYSVLSLGANHMVYDPYSQKLMTAVSSGSSAVAGSSIVAITPATATIGSPVTLTNVPTELALSNSGQTLYAANSTAASLARYNMLTGAVDTVTIPTSSTFPLYYTPFAYGIGIAPGTENTLAISLGNYYYNTGIFDYAESSKTLTERSIYSSNYYNLDCLRLLDGTSLFGTSGSGSITYFGYNASGFTSTTGTSTSLNNFSCFKLAGANAYAASGGVAALSSSGSVSQLGSFSMSQTYNYGGAGIAPVEPDLSLGQVFFAGVTGGTSYSYGYADGLLSFDAKTYVRNAVLPLNIPTIEGTSSYSVPDLIRWGQDGIALLTSTGHIYLVRGPFVVPQLLNTNSAATLTASSASTVTHGAGNTLLTLTGSNFVPGVAVTWNGSYRTTTIVDATHVTVAIPASDLAAAGSGSLVATNPGAGASAALTVTIQ